MRYKMIATGLIIVLALLSLSAKSCSSTPPDSPLREPAKAADDIAGSINAMIKLKRQLAQQGTITPEEELALTNLLLKVNSADKVFVQKIKALKAAPDAQTKANLATVFASVTSAIDELNTNGILSVKNADARGKLTNILTAISASVTIITNFLQPT